MKKSKRKPSAPKPQLPIPRNAKTIEFAKLQRLTFVNSADLPHRIVHEGEIKEWTGIGWITLCDQTLKGTEVYVSG